MTDQQLDDLITLIKFERFFLMRAKRLGRG